MKDGLSDKQNKDNLRSRFELKTLLDTSRLLIESHDPDFVMNNLLLITMGKLLSLKGLILLREGNSFYVAGTKGSTGLKKGQSVLMGKPDQFTENAWYKAADIDKALNTDFLVSKGLCNVFPIRTSSSHIGYLCIGPKVGNNEYAPAELEFIENLVIISAVAISNSMLVSKLRDTNRELDRKVQELNTLFDISREFNAMVDRAQILNVFKFSLMGQMFIRKFFFLMNMDGEPEVIIQQGLKGLISTEDKKRLISAADEVTLTEEISPKIDYLTENDIHALVPLRFQDETAILGIGIRANKQAYSQSDFNYLTSLGSLAFLSVQKTFLLEARIEKERLAEELNIARTIQNALFPNPIPAPDDYNIAATNVPSRQVGGDYYDVIRPNDRHLYVAIADVTGKGIPASLLMANLQAMLQVLAPLDLPLDQSTGKINDIIYKNTPSDKFISFFWGCLDLEDHTFYYCNAGHNPPVLVRKDADEPELLTDGGMLLGALPSMMPYVQGSVKLNEGDCITMFTDGVSEAMDEEENEYGEERIAELSAAHKSESAQKIMQHILKDVREFCNNDYGDDLTMLLLQRNG